MATGRHAAGKGKHRAAPSRPPLVARVLILVLVLTALAVFLPVIAGLGLLAGIFFGWMGRAITRT